MVRNERWIWNEKYIWVLTLIAHWLLIFPPDLNYLYHFLNKKSYSQLFKTHGTGMCQLVFIALPRTIIEQGFNDQSDWYMLIAFY